MHITRVELENIKSYEHAEFAFEPGTTAIVGKNGAGKTTIIEAIAWALFDTLDYKKEDFLRRGSKKGIARVTFESDLDERQYTVYRDTGTGYYVYDPGLKLRVAEKKIDVAAFLRQHLDVEPGTDLKALFQSAIGVPQGLFTAPFLDTSEKRKATFDRLLKVEEYRQGAEKLLETTKLIRDRVMEVRERIAGVEGQLARYDDLTEECCRAATQESELTTRLEALQRQAQQHAEIVNALDTAEQQAVELRRTVERLTVERSSGERRLIDARREHQVAVSARVRQHATQADYQVHTETLDELRHLEVARRERDEVRRAADKVNRQIDKTESDLRRIEEALAAAVCARIALGELGSDIEEQENHESERERLRELRAHSVAAGERLARLETELGVLRSQHAQIRERIKGAEAAREAQRHVERLENERVGVETELGRVREAFAALTHLTNNRKQAAREVERMRAVVEALEREVVKLTAKACGADQVSVIELRERKLSEQLAHLRAEIARDQRMREEVQGGLCPILSERCLNIGENQTLDNYFTDQLTTNAARLTEIENERAHVADAVRAARESAVAVAQLDREKVRLVHERDLLNERVAALRSLDAEVAAITAIADTERRRVLEIELFGIDSELKQQREASQRYAELESLRVRLKEIEDEGKRKKEDHAELAAAASAISGLDLEITDIEIRLRALDDPRARAVSLRREAEREASLQADETLLRPAWHTLKLKEEQLTIELRRFDQLDERWTEAIAKRDATAAAYREYLQSAQAASTLRAREQAVEQAATEAAHLTEELERSRELHARALAAYDAERHQAERAALMLVREHSAATTAQLNLVREQRTTLEIEIARLDELRASLRDELAAKERLETLHGTTDFIRDTLKQAGPLVTESYLYNVSIEANQLFREISGEAARELRWSRDYEIILEEGGYERSFLNLSGGEQMTAALSVRLALLKQLSDIRVAFFDEPTVNMDAERRERLAQQIGQVRHFKQLFVISHDDTFEESVDHVVMVPPEQIAAVLS